MKRHAILAALAILAVMLTYSFTAGPLFYVLLFVTVAAMFPHRQKILEGLNFRQEYNELTLNGRTVFNTEGTQNRLKLMFDEMGFTSGNVKGYIY